MRHSQHHALRRLMWGEALDVLVAGGRDYGYWFQWCDGGCAMAAYGLRTWLRASGADGVVAIVEDDRVPGLAQHLVAVVGPYYLDADGIRQQRALLAGMRRTLQRPYVVPVRADIDGIRRDPDVSRDLARLLMHRLGPYQPSQLAH